MEFTNRQLEAIQSEHKRLIILSCAGSGKTTVIVNRINHLITEKGVIPSQILALTFGNKAAQDMRNKIIQEVKTLIPLKVSTFHAFGLELIRKYHEQLGMEARIAILSDNERKEILKSLVGLGVDPERVSEYIRHIKSLASLSSDDITLQQTVHNLDDIVQAFNQRLNIENKVDMEDMLYLPYILLQKNSEVRAAICENYKYIFVDEYQDTNEIQNRFLDLICNQDTSICLVGDDDQAIYEFRGAKPQYIREKATDKAFHCIKLETNFRSQGAIIKIANRIIQNNTHRVSKQIIPDREDGSAPYFQRFNDDKAEANFVAEKIDELIRSNRFHPSDIAVLYKATQQVDVIKKALETRHIKYEVRNVDKTYRHSKFLAALRCVDSFSSAKDVIAAVNFPSMCMDRFVLDRVKGIYNRETGNTEQFSPLEWLKRIYMSSIHYGDDEILISTFKKRYKTITEIQMAQDFSAKQAIAFLISSYEAEGLKEADPLEYHFALQTLDLASTFEKTYGSQSLRDYIADLNSALEQDEFETQIDTDAVSLMTMHRSKGLEFKVVFIIGMQVGICPNDYFVHTLDDLEAERRLFYVAITRAKELLFLSSHGDQLLGSDDPENLVKHGFMAEIPDLFLSRKPIDRHIIEAFPIKKTIEIVKETAAEITEKVLETTPSEIVAEIKNIVNEEIVDGTIPLGAINEDSIVHNRQVSYQLLSEYKVPKDKRIVILGAVDMKISIMYGVLGVAGFTKDMIEYYDYEGRNFNAARLVNNSRYIGIIVGPVAHKIPSVSTRSVKELLEMPGYPYMVNLIDRKITKTSLNDAISVIKWNYYSQEQGNK